MLRRLDETDRHPIDAEVAASTAIGATGRVFFTWLIGAHTTHFDTRNHDLRRQSDATLRPKASTRYSRSCKCLTPLRDLAIAGQPTPATHIARSVTRGPPLLVHSVSPLLIRDLAIRRSRRSRLRAEQV